MRDYSNPKSQLAVERILAVEHDPETMRTAFDQLRPAERIFVKAFVTTDSPAKAARAAFPGVLPSVINVRANDMLKRPLVQAAIAQYVKDATSKFEVTLDRTLEEIAKIGYANIASMLKKDPETGELIIDAETGMPVGDMSGMSADDLAAVAGFEVKELKNGNLVIMPKMHSKNDALDKLMRYLGAYAPEKQIVDINKRSVNINVDMTPEQAADLYARSLEGDD